MADTVGMQDIRGLNVNKIVTGFALQEFIMKQLVRVSGSSKWQERYYQETAADLTATAPSVIEGVNRLSSFPTLEVSWTQMNSYHKKHAAETTISWEDAISNDIPVIERSLLRIARAIAKSVDGAIWTELTVNNYATINSGAATIPWASASSTPLANILEAKRAIWAQNYNPDRNGYLLLSPLGYKDLVQYLIHTKGASIPQFASEKVVNGNVGQILGLNILVSNVVAASGAVVIIGQECGNYLELEPLNTITIPDQGIKYTIRSWEIGVPQCTNPKAIYYIEGC